MVVILLLIYGASAVLFLRWLQQNLLGASMKGLVNCEDGLKKNCKFCCICISCYWDFIGAFACLEILIVCIFFCTYASKVAAMFKIGNSKELPTIPDHLSEDGKDFVRLCLQRNPLHRPSAAQLLEHPFVKNATLERPILTTDSSDVPSAVTNAVRSLVRAIEVSMMLFLWTSCSHMT